MSIGLGHSWPSARLLPVSLPQEREQIRPFRSLARLKGCHPSQTGERIQARQAARTPVPAPSTRVCVYVCGGRDQDSALAAAGALPAPPGGPRVRDSGAMSQSDVQSRGYAPGHCRDQRGACGGKGGEGESRPAVLQSLIWGSSRAAGRLRHESTRARQVLRVGSGEGA